MAGELCARRVRAGGAAAPAQVRGRRPAAFNPAGTYSAQNSPDPPAPWVGGDLSLNIELCKAGGGYGGGLIVLTNGNRTVSSSSHDFHPFVLGAAVLTHA